MISLAHIAHWRSTQAPWASQTHVEQDLVLARSLVELFANPLVSSLVALRGGLIQLDTVFGAKVTRGLTSKNQEYVLPC